MSCTGREEPVETALRTLDGVHRVTADHERNTVEIVTDDSVSERELYSTIEHAGYDVTG